MEQIIPIVVAAIVFGFQAYNNYQKEKEKAKKRNPGRPVEELPELEQPDLDFPFLDDLKEVFFPEDPAQRKSTPTSRTKSAPKTTSLEPVPSASSYSQYQDYQGAVVPEEVRRVRQKKSTIIPEVVLEDLDDTDPSADAWTKQRFDLRQAMIHSIILERPYK